MNILALILTFLVGLFIFTGYICGIKFKNNNKLTDFSLSLAFGVIISLIVLELIPETYEILNKEVGNIRTIFLIIILSLIGIVLLKILDLFIPHHEHEAHHHHNHSTNKCHNEHLYHIAIISMIGIIFHNIIEGASLYLVAQSSFTSGLLLCIGIGLHNIPMGLVISQTLINSNYSNKKIFNINILLTLSTFIGGFVMFIFGSINELTEGLLLGVTLGMLIYISLFELLHQIYHMKNKIIPKIGISIGIILLIISIIIENIVG